MLSISLIGFPNMWRVQEKINKNGEKKMLHFSLLNAFLFTLVVKYMCSSLSREILNNVLIGQIFLNAFQPLYVYMQITKAIYANFRKFLKYH